MLDVSILTSQCCCWLCMCCVVYTTVQSKNNSLVDSWVATPMSSWHLSSWLPPKQLSMGKQWSNQPVIQIKSKLVQVKGLPYLRLLAFCNATNFNISFQRKLKCKSSKCILPAAKTLAWVQYLLLYYLFTYT